MSTYLNIARLAKAAGKKIRVTNRLGIGYVGVVDYFFEAAENTAPECAICLSGEGWAGRFFNESDIQCIELA